MFRKLLPIFIGIYVLMLVASLLVLANCAKRRPQTLPPPPPEETNNDTGNAFLVHVAYATDRVVSGRIGDVQAFGGKRDHLRYGHAVVSIPRSHEPGEVELPRWFRLELQPDSSKHFTVASSALISADEWSADIRARVAASKNKAVFLFVHGYNVDFNSALMRTAQIEHDVTFPGPAVLFSWPSKGSVAGYTADEEDARWAVPDMLQVLRRLVQTTAATDIYIIAHSMGNRVLTEALAQLGKADPSVRLKIKEVILAAPDIDADVFKQQIAPALSTAAQRYTLYASSRDRALAMSARVHGYVRLGDTHPRISILPPIQTIDASSTSDDMLGHSYIGDSTTVLGDVRRVFMNRETPAQRGLVPVGPSGRYWRFPVALPASK